MRPVPALLAGLLLCVRASAGGVENFRLSAEAGFAQETAVRPDMTAFRAAYQEAQQDAQAFASEGRQVLVPLPDLLNNMRRTPTVFKAGGANVHVFGLRAQNNPGLTGWYIAFTVEGGETVYYQGINALHLKKLGIGVSRHLEVKLNGRLFDLQVKAAVLNWMNSRVVITPKEFGAAPIVFTVGQLADGVYEAGWPLSLGGRDYRLLYTENIIELPGGGVTPNEDRVIGLMFRDGKGISGYGWLERYIPRDKPLLTWVVAKGAESDGEPGPAFSVMIQSAGQLDLRYHAPPPAKKR